MADPATVALVHGAWHGAWCWDKVVAQLADAHVPVIAVDLPFTSFHDDVNAVRKALDTASDRVVLCGHSYGGAVISEADAGVDSVRHLVYLDYCVLLHLHHLGE